jgi:hypothetical protein
MRLDLDLGGGVNQTLPNSLSRYLQYLPKLVTHFSNIVSTKTGDK